MSCPQSRPQFRPQFNMYVSRDLMLSKSIHESDPAATQSATWSNPRFPPAPPSSPPPTLAYPFPSRPINSTLLTYFAMSTPTQVASPSTPSIPSTQPRQVWKLHFHAVTRGTDQRLMIVAPMALIPILTGKKTKITLTTRRSMGLTFPRCIRPSAFTQKLDIEGCDPLKLPVAALLYQQANNFWLRKLAHGRELYLIPTGDIAAVVFMTELLTLDSTSKQGSRPGQGLLL